MGSTRLVGRGTMFTDPLQTYFETFDVWDIDYLSDTILQMIREKQNNALENGELPTHVVLNPLVHKILQQSHRHRTRPRESELVNILGMTVLIEDTKRLVYVCCKTNVALYGYNQVKADSIVARIRRYGERTRSEVQRQQGDTDSAEDA